MLGNEHRLCLWNPVRVKQTLNLSLAQSGPVVAFSILVPGNEIEAFVWGGVFAEVFEELLMYFDEETAYTIVERIKRGLVDTSRPGALTKEYHYFTGPERVRSYLHSRGNLQMLMGGKIAFKHARVIEKLVQKGLVDISKWVFPVGIKGDRESIPA